MAISRHFTADIPLRIIKKKNNESCFKTETLDSVKLLKLKSSTKLTLKDSSSCCSSPIVHILSIFSIPPLLVYRFVSQRVGPTVGQFLLWFAANNLSHWPNNNTSHHFLYPFVLWTDLLTLLLRKWKIVHLLEPLRESQRKTLPLKFPPCREEIERVQG